jgi:uncharacterized metal-binding protein (TIGR02443 family)|tara:strand:- start:379 stop:585 length:207 start_codon:yes stop_codon:yes gene_type:complete
MKKLVQFIAGAVCPSCKAQDTIAINSDDDEIYCAKCNFFEKRPKAVSQKNNAIKALNIQDFSSPKTSK